MATALKTIELFTDGACSGNPGVGGWAAILRYNNIEKELSGATADTTNNRMELTAVIKGLEALKTRCAVVICTDSQYVFKGASVWLPDWKARGWKTGAKKPVLNVDLWERLDALLPLHRIEWQWVKGHSGHPENERADTLACAAIEDFKATHS